MIYNKNNFSIVSLSPSKNESYYLEGVHVTPDHTEVTNGHYLARVTVPFTGDDLKAAIDDLPKVEGHEPKKPNGNGLEAGFTFPAKAVIEVERSIPNSKHLKQLNNTWITENTTDEEVEFVSYDMETVKPIKARKLEGKWPNTDMVMPKDKPELTLGFNPEYMFKICQLFKKMKLKAVRLDLYGEKKAMRMLGRTEEGQEVTVVLMPMLTDIKAPEDYKSSSDES